MAKKKLTLSAEAERLLEDCLIACQDHGRSVGVDGANPERADTHIRRQLRKLAVEAQNKTLAALRQHMLAREEEVVDLVNQRYQLSEALRRVLVADGILHADARPNGPELIAAAEDHLRAAAENPVLPPPPLSDSDKNNFATLRRAEAAGHLALVSAIRKADRKPVALVCAMHTEGDFIRPVPLAVMIEGNPFEDFEDPTRT